MRLAAHWALECDLPGHRDNRTLDHVNQYATSRDCVSDPQMLAIDGGQPVIPEGPPAWPEPDPDIQEALAQLAASSAWGKYRGRMIEELTAKLAEFHGVAFARPCCSGTFAVELALRALRIGPGDEVLLAAYDFPGNFRAVTAVGAVPVLVDVRPDNWLLDPGGLEQVESGRIKAVIVSHLHGCVLPMPQILDISRRRGWHVVEDACQATGASIEGRIAGAWGDVGVISFGGSKLLSAGRGGAILSSLPQVMQRARVYCEQGNDAFPLSELQATVLLPQLEKLPARNHQRAAAVNQLREATRVVLGLQWLATGETHGAFYKLGFRYRPAPDAGNSRDQFAMAMRAEGVAVDAGFRGFTGRSARRCRAIGDLRHAREAAENLLILHHPVLLADPDTLSRVGQTFVKVCSALPKQRREGNTR